jgi:anaerobic ribonucleoside-triphosphate reductase activating protein
MKIGGIIKTSLVDYPGKVACSIFTIGCNFRCGYCHNPELVVPDKYILALSSDDVLEYLKTRIGLLDGVAISGGEPTLHKDLPIFIKSIKDMGFLVKLDSNGSNPDMLEELLTDKLVDFIAMDVKGPLRKYEEIMGWQIDPKTIERSVGLIKNSGLPHEFRTTIVKSQLEVTDFVEIGELVKGAKQFALQHFKAIDEMVDTDGFRNEVSFSDEEFDQAQTIMSKYVERCIIH